MSVLTSASRDSAESMVLTHYTGFQEKLQRPHMLAIFSCPREQRTGAALPPSLSILETIMIGANSLLKSGSLADR